MSRRGACSSGSTTATATATAEKKIIVVCWSN